MSAPSKYAPEFSPYGLPHYLASITDIDMAASAKKLRENFYDNGAHLGGLLAMNYAFANNEERDSFKTELKETSGKAKKDGEQAGSLAFLPLNSPNARSIKDILSFIDSGELFKGDDFVGTIKVASREVVAAHRVPQELMGVFSEARVPANLEKLWAMFWVGTVMPWQERLKNAINPALPVAVDLIFEDRKGIFEDSKK